MNILLLSGYDAASHRQWREGLVRHLDEHHWEVHALGPRHFSWRTRGTSLWWAMGPDLAPEHAHHARPWQAMVATSMVDLASLRGLRPDLARLPSVVYFHENQVSYPLRAGQRPDIHPVLTNLYTALSADVVVFNSAFNRTSFLEGTARWLERLPDAVPRDVLEQLEGRCRTIAVPLEHGRAPGCEVRRTGPLQVLWNHRWEYDKGPDRFFAAMERLDAMGCDFALHVVGERFRQVPPAFERARQALGPRIATWGYLAGRTAYEALLARADVVVSTALHEFQGIAVQEAMAAGCHALVPDRLAYREYVPAHARYPSFVEDPEREAHELGARLAAMCRGVEDLRRQPPVDMQAYSWAHLAPFYRQALEDALQAARLRP